jgi:hypothetical protein
MPEATEDKYEKRDLNPRAIAWFTGGLAVLAVVVLIVMAVLMRVLSRGELPGQGVVPPGQTSIAPIDRSPQPDLQITPMQDLRHMREIEDAQLKNYGWVDRQAGIAAIPIDRAMEILADRAKARALDMKAGQDKKEPQ